MSQVDLLWRLGLALVLSSAIGLERELRNRSAGLRTHALVGVGTALFMIVSQFGFADALHHGTVELDPSRVAAQVVSGIGFIGAGLIFVRRDAVRGLTSAAVVWLVAAIGLACGGALWLLAIAATLVHFLVVYGYTPLAQRLPRSRFAPSSIRLVYSDGRGVLRDALAVSTGQGFGIADVSVERTDGSAATVAVNLEVHGTGSIAELAASLGEIDGVLQVIASDVNDSSP